MIRRSISLHWKIRAEDEELIGYLMLKVKDVAKELGLENGYRLVNNCGEDGKQTVKHLHFHLLGKRAMKWAAGLIPKKKLA
jgi:histidine triad (HIT) family protein